MEKINKLVLIILLILVLVSCSNEQPQINLTQYPTQITKGENFTIKGEFLTAAAEAREVSIMLTIRELGTEQGLLSKSISLTDESQEFSFSNLNLQDVESNLRSGSLYFEVKLIVNGNFKTKISTEDDSSLIANWHTNIITTYFTATSSSGDSKLGTWGNKLAEENPYYFALPYRDFYYYVDGSDNPVRKDYYGITDVKNRWIEIYYPTDDAQNNYVYAQWEDVGPWNYYDPHYVFSTNDQRPYAEMGIDMGWTEQGYRSTNGAGLDLSATAMKYLTGSYNQQPAKGKIKVNWRFVSKDEVPDGPWLNEVSLSKADLDVLNLKTETLRNLEN